MVTLSGFRDKIANKIFTSDIKSTAVLSSLTSASNDKWGDEQSSFSAGTNIDIIPYLYIENRQSYQPFGDLQDSQMDLVVPYSVTVNPKDRLAWQGDNYFITEIDKSAWIGNGLIVQIVRVQREA